MPRTLSPSSAVEVARQHGANFLLVFAWYADGVWHYFSDSPRTIEVTPGTPLACDPRVSSWGTLSLQIDPEKVGGIAETQITLHDCDTAGSAAGLIRELVDASLQPSSSLFELSMLFIVPDPQTLIPVVQPWADRMVLHRGSVVAPAFELANRIWTLKLRDLGAYYDRPLGFRVDRNNFEDTRGTVGEGAILPIAFGDPVLRVPAVLIDRPGIGVLAEVLYSNEGTLTLVDTAKTGGFETEDDLSPPALPKRFIVGVPGNIEEIEGYVVGATEADREDSVTIAITERGWIVVAGIILSQTGSAPFFRIVVNQNDFVLGSPDVSRNGHVIHFSTDNFVSYEYRTITYWKRQAGGNVEIGYSGEFDYTFGDLYRIARHPGYIAEWPPGTPIYEVGDWTYCTNAIPSTEIVRLEARAEIPSPGGGTPIKQHYTFADEYWSANLNNQDYNEELGREPGDDGITTVTLDKSPEAVGFTDKTVYVTLRGPARNSVVAKYAPDIIDILATHPALGDISTVEHVDDAQLTEASTWLDTNRPVKLAFAITEQQQLNDVIGKAALNGTCGAIWDQGVLRVVPWPGWDTAISGAALGNADSTEWPKEELIEWKEMPTLALGKFRPYPSGDEITYVRRTVTGEAILGRREKTFEFAMIQRPTSIVLALEFWFGWWIGRQTMIDIGGFVLPSYLLALLDFKSIAYTDGAGTSLLTALGPILEQSIKLPEPINGKAVELSLKLVARRREFEIVAISIEDIDIDPNCGDLPAIDPGYGWPNPNLSS